jgi:hypothetical protein
LFLTALPGPEALKRELQFAMCSNTRKTEIRGNHCGVTKRSLKSCDAGPQLQCRSNEFALHGIHNRFQTIVGAQLLIDVVQVVAQRLQADIQGLCDFRRIFPLCEKP